jgi:phenylacetate-CoA ligase
MRAGDALAIASSVLGLQRSQWLSAARIRDRQLGELRATLEFALQRVPHYRKLQIDRSSRDPRDWLSQFPILSKSDVQGAGRALLADSLDEQDLHRSHTSGSTGEPTVSWFDRRTWLYCKYALKLRRMLGCGLGPGTTVLIVSEADETDLREKRSTRMTGAGWLYGQEYLSLRGALDEHIRELQRLRPDAIYAFPSYFADLLDHCERERIELPPVRVVFTSSEVLTDALRRRLSEQLHAHVCDVYGCTEFKEVAWQCKSGSYHVNHESVWIEIRHESDDASGAVLLTTLINRAAPLIRYRIGDLGRLDWISCACGREGPVLSGLEGREVELLALPDGRRLSPYLLTTAVEEVAGLRQYQFVQTAANRLEMRFVAFDGQSVDRTELHERLGSMLGQELQVRLLAVPAIPRTPGGKRKVFVRAPAAATGVE